MINLKISRPTTIALGSLALALALLPAMQPAWAQTSAETQVLLERINRLESDMNSLQRQLYRGGAASAPPAAGAPLTAAGGETATARLSLQIDALEEKLSSLTGRMEEVDHRSQEVSRRLDKLIEDVDFRLKALERPPAGAAGAAATPGEAATGAAAPPTGAAAARQAPGQPGVLGTIPAKELPPGGQSAAIATPAPGAGDKPVTLPPGSAQEQYNFATKLLHQGDYGQAEQALTLFVAAHPSDPLASAAQYWLGETFFVRQQYDRAAAAFLAGYQKYPKGSKAPDDLLKLAMSLNNLNQKKEACAVFKQLATEYPNAEARIRQNAARERSKAGCTG